MDDADSQEIASDHVLELLDAYPLNASLDTNTALTEEELLRTPDEVQSCELELT